MMMEAHVSICIPVYNGATYLEACLDSVFSQTYPNYEVLIVDDGSTDQSPEIIESYRQKYASRLRYYRNPENLGLVGNWNRCLDLAGGEWIKFVFQDDTIDAHCLEKMLAAAGDNHPFVVCKRAFLIEENAADFLKTYFREEVLTLERIYNGKVPAFISSAEIIKLSVKYLSVNFIGEPPAVMFKRSLIAEVGKFDPDILQICDLEYWLRMATLHGLCYVREELASFRIHSSSTTSGNTIKRKFISLYSDPAIFSHKLLTDPVFDNFRKSLSRIENGKLMEYRKMKIYEAHKFLDEEPGENNSAYVQVFRKYSVFDSLKTPSWSTRIVYLLVRLKRKLSQ